MDIIVLDGNDIPNPEDMAMVQATSPPLLNRKPLTTDPAHTIRFWYTLS